MNKEDMQKLIEDAKVKRPETYKRLCEALDKAELTESDIFMCLDMLNNQIICTLCEDKNLAIKISNYLHNLTNNQIKQYYENKAKALKEV